MLILNGRTEPGALLWVDNEKVDVTDDGTFYAVIRLRKEGVNEVLLQAQDASGNVREADPPRVRRSLLVSAGRFSCFSLVSGD